MSVSLPDRFRVRFEAVRGVVHRAADWAGAAGKAAEICRQESAACIALGNLPSPFVEAFEADSGGFSQILKPPYGFKTLPGAIDAADAGIAGADFAIAETGTLVEIATDDALRLVSSLPRTYIGVVSTDAFIEKLADAAVRIREAFANRGENCVVSFISGPSRTGDIEMILTLGVHGPERAHVIIVGEADTSK